jgi:nucleoside 2-deoxyribosyltransferase
MHTSSYMHIYLAGKLHTPYEKELLERVDALCKRLGHTTFLPHRDVGIAQTSTDAPRIFAGDITQGMQGVTRIIAVLDGLHVGAGTAWELGYAYAKDIPALGLKTDETPEEGFEYLSSILLASMPIVASLTDVEAWLSTKSIKGNKK